MTKIFFFKVAYYACKSNPKADQNGKQYTNL